MSRSRRPSTSKSNSSESGSEDDNRKSSSKGLKMTSGGKDGHPSFKFMITEAIFMQRKIIKGSSRAEIKRYISEKWGLDKVKISDDVSSTISKMLKTDEEDGYSCLLSAENNYKLNPEWRKEWTKMYGIKQQRRTRRKKKPSDYPLHFRSAYMFFAKEARKRVASENPDKKFPEISKIVSTEWGKISESKKKKFEEMAKKDKIRYKNQMKEYKKNRSSSSSGSYSSDSEERSKSRRRRRSRSVSASESESSPKKKKTKKNHDEPQIKVGSFISDLKRYNSWDMNASDASDILKKLEKVTNPMFDLDNFSEYVPKWKDELHSLKIGFRYQINLKTLDVYWETRSKDKDSFDADYDKITNGPFALRMASMITSTEEYQDTYVRDCFSEELLKTFKELNIKLILKGCKDGRDT